MTTTSQTLALEDWLRSNGGYLNHAITVTHSPTQGIHWRTSVSLAPNTPICMVPHSLALSHLNALVDDSYPFFKTRRKDLKVENIGFFYLMTQYIHREKSFYKPYLDLLPAPDSTEFLTPLWFEAEEDLKWLEGTDVLFTARGRVEVYERYWADGVEVLKGAGIDVEPYTWRLFKWAVTMFTSRSFSSRALAPAESRYWSAYKTGPQGRRQAVLMDMSHVPAADLDFPVLFPAMDVGNHKQDAHVLWSYDPGQFSMVTEEAHAAGEEVFNNYGMGKSNSELFMGYGFCIPNNPNDAVLVTLKAPPQDLQDEIKVYHSRAYFDDDVWSGPKATFSLKAMDCEQLTAEKVFTGFPEPLLELLVYLNRHGNGMAFQFIEQPLTYLLDTSSPGRRLLPFIARYLVMSLAPKLEKLQNSDLPSTPENARQRVASTYRNGQIHILDSIISTLKAFTRSYLIPATQSGPRLVTSEGLLQIWAGRTDVAVVGQFLSGIEANAGTYDMALLREYNWEQDVMILLLCAMQLTAAEGQAGQWVRDLVPEYLDGTVMLSTCSRISEERDLMATVLRAKDAAPDSLWSDSRWSDHYINSTGGRMVQCDTMLMMVPNEAGREEPRHVVYLHTN